MSSCCSSTFNLSSILISIAFSELSFKLWTHNFQVFIFFCNVWYTSLGLSLLSKQYSIFSHFRPHLLLCIHDRLIHVLHKCDFLLHFYFWVVCNNNFAWAQSVCSFKQFSISNGWIYITHTKLLFCHRGSCSCVLLKFIFINFFFQIFYVSMLQHLFWASIPLSLSF